MAVGWILIGILLVIVLVLIFKSQDLMFVFVLIKKYFLVIIVAAVVLFFVFSIYYNYNSYDADFSTFSGVLGFGKHYFSWLGNAFDNIGDITGYAVQRDWFNATNATNVSR